MPDSGKNQTAPKNQTLVTTPSAQVAHISGAGPVGQEFCLPSARAIKTWIQCVWSVLCVCVALAGEPAQEVKVLSAKPDNQVKPFGSHGGSRTPTSTTVLIDCHMFSVA